VIDQHLCRDASISIDIEWAALHVGRVDQYVKPVQPLPFHDVLCHPPHLQEPGKIKLKRLKLVQIIQQVRRLAKHSCNRFHRLCKGAGADLDFSTSKDELVGYVPADIIWIVACKSNDGDFALERWKSSKFVSDGYDSFGGVGEGHIGSGEVSVYGRTMSGGKYAVCDQWFLATGNDRGYTHESEKYIASERSDAESDDGNAKRRSRLRGG
jgi:hypothetical protein